MSILDYILTFAGGVFFGILLIALLIAGKEITKDDSEFYPE